MPEINVAYLFVNWHFAFVWVKSSKGMDIIEVLTLRILAIIQDI